MPVLTYFKDIEDDRDFKFIDLIKRTPQKVEKKRATYALQLDYRKFLSPVKNQGNLGSCVGFAVTALKEFHENVEYASEQAAGSNYTREESVYDLSEQWTYWNAKKIDPWGPDVEGTSIRYAMKVLQKIGCPPEEGWKYTDNKVDIGKPESWTHMISRWNTIKSYWRVESLKYMLRALRSVGPIVIGVGCYEEIFSPGKDGVVAYPANPGNMYGGHAILACGYDYETKRVLFKNSWGTGWGDNGYGWFSFDYMRDFCWDAWAAQDERVTKAMIRGTVTL